MQVEKAKQNYNKTTKQYKPYNIEISNIIKLRILEVWQNAYEYFRQLVCL